MEKKRNLIKPKQKPEIKSAYDYLKEMPDEIFSIIFGPELTLMDLLNSTLTCSKLHEKMNGQSISEYMIWKVLYMKKFEKYPYWVRESVKNIQEQLTTQDEIQNDIVRFYKNLYFWSFIALKYISDKFKIRIHLDFERKKANNEKEKIDSFSQIPTDGYFKKLPESRQIKLTDNIDNYKISIQITIGAKTKNRNQIYKVLSSSNKYEMKTSGDDIYKVSSDSKTVQPIINGIILKLTALHSLIEQATCPNGDMYQYQLEFISTPNLIDLINFMLLGNDHDQVFLDKYLKYTNKMSKNYSVFKTILNDTKKYFKINLVRNSKFKKALYELFFASLFLTNKTDMSNLLKGNYDSINVLRKGIRSPIETKSQSETQSLSETDSLPETNSQKEIETILQSFQDSFTKYILMNKNSPDFKIIIPKVSCNVCHVENSLMFLCTNCKDAIYCSKKCQRHHWDEHKKECLIN